MIKTSIYKGARQTNFGEIHNYFIELENGDKGYASLKKQSDKLDAGKEIDYTIEVVKTEKGEFNKIKLVNKTPFGVGAKEKPQEKMIGFAMSYTKDLIIADKIKIESLESTFDKIYSIMVNKL